MIRPAAASMFLACLMLLSLPVHAQWSFTEDFSTTTYRDDSNTTADWDTGAGEVRMQGFALNVLDDYVTGGGAFDVSIQGNFAYVVDNPDVRIFNIADPTNILLISTFANSNPQALFIDGDLLYVADAGAGLAIYDVSFPSSPILVGSLNTPDFAQDVVVEGDLAYVADRFSGLRIIDVNDPTTPFLLGVYDTPNQARGIDVEGDVCYVADRGGSGIIVLDVSDPTNPLLIGGNLMSADTWNVSVEGDIAYVADTSAGLGILNVADPTNPTLIGSVDPGAVRQITVAGDRVYAAGFADFHIIDVTEPASPFVVESWTTPGTLSGVDIAGEFVALADGPAGGLILLEVRDVVPQPVELGDIHVGTSPLREMRVAGDLLYATYGNTTLAVYDISSPTPVQIGTEFIANVSVLDISGNYAFVGAGTTLKIFDISDPTDPTEVGQPLDFGTSVAQDLRVRGNLIYAALASTGVGVIDISDPLAPTLLTSFAGGPQGTLRIDVQGDFVYTFMTGQGLNVYDVSNPLAAFLTDTWSTSEYITDIAVEGNYAMIMENSGLFRAVNITDPFNIWPNGIRNIGGFGGSLALSGDLVFATGFGIAPAVIDVSDPGSPQLLGTSTSPNVGYGPVVVAGNLIFVGSDFGLRSFQVFQSELDGDANIAQSEQYPLASGNADVYRVRLTTSQVGIIDYGVRTDFASGFQPLLADGEWNEVADPGSVVEWRASFNWSESGLNPTLEELTLEWLVSAPKGESVTDIANDQGRQVRVEWSRSGHDFVGDPQQIVEYAVYREIDPGLGAIVARAAPPADLSPAAQDHAALMAAAGWDFLMTVPVRVEDRYAVVVPTLADSTVTEGIHLTNFMVSALTATPGVYFDSDPIGGYSVDNLAPASPQNLAVGYMYGSGNVLAWDESAEEDFAHYRVYRSTDPGFIPTPQDLVGEPATPGWTDPEHDGTGVHYRVTAVDFSGNESEIADPQTITSTEPTVAPRRFALHANVPNPFNPSTEIFFEVPTNAGRVALRVYDTAGRLVRTLVEGELDAGHRSEVWDGRTDAGASVASGVYYYRLEATGFGQTRKMVLVK